jgi:hypothetical protein
MGRYDYLLKNDDDLPPPTSNPKQEGRSPSKREAKVESGLADEFGGGLEAQTQEHPFRLRMQDQVAGQSTHQPANPPTGQLASKPKSLSSSKIVEKAFYITEKLDKRLDEAVRYLQDVQGIRKADRSSIINAMLDNEANWSDESLDLIVDRVIQHLMTKIRS